MPTNNPRINVTRSPSLDALVARLASLQRASKSQVLRELLEAAEPALQRAANLMEAASKAHGAALERFTRVLDESQAEAEEQLYSALESADSMTADLVAKAEAIRGRRPGRATRSAHAPATVLGEAAKRPGTAKRAMDPPPSNRGVKSSSRAQARGIKGRVK